MLIPLLLTTALAADVTAPVQARLLDALGAPVAGTVTLDVSLCPNASPTPGETCVTEQFTGLDVADGYVSVTLGAGGGLDHAVFEQPALYVAFAVDGVALAPRQPVGDVRPRPRGLSAVVPLGPAAFQYRQPTTGQVALFLQFEDGFVDSGPYRHVVEARGNARLVTDTPAGDQAVRFGDPGPSWLRVPASPAFGVASNQDFTIEYWARYEAAESGGSDQRVFQFGANATDGFRNCHSDPGSNLNLGTNTNFANGIPINTLYGTGWHHIAWSRQGSTLRVFLDGALMTSTTFTASNSAARDLYFATYPGAVGDGANYWMNGRIDDFRFIVGEALYTAPFDLPASATPGLIVEDGVITGYTAP